MFRKIQILLPLPICDRHREPPGRALLHDSREPLVCPDRRVLKLPRLLPGRWRFLPLELPGESSQERSCDDSQGTPGELGMLLGRFGESKAVQLRVDLNRRHVDIIPSRMVSAAGTSRDIGLTSEIRSVRTDAPVSRLSPGKRHQARQPPQRNVGRLSITDIAPQ